MSTKKGCIFMSKCSVQVWMWWLNLIPSFSFPSAHPKSLPHPPPPFGVRRAEREGRTPLSPRSVGAAQTMTTTLIRPKNGEIVYYKGWKKGSLCRESIICNRKKRSAFDYKDQLAPTIFLHYTVNNTRVYKYSGNPLYVAELPTFLPIIKWQ